MHYRVASFSYSYPQLKNDMTAKLQTKRDASMKKTSFLDYFEPNYIDVVSPSLEKMLFAYRRRSKGQWRWTDDGRR
jgi:hypothetical protein